MSQFKLSAPGSYGAQQLKAWKYSLGLDWSHVAAVHTSHVPEPDGHIVASNVEVARRCWAIRGCGWRSVWWPSAAGTSPGNVPALA